MYIKLVTRRRVIGVALFCIIVVTVIAAGLFAWFRGRGEPMAVVPDATRDASAATSTDFVSALTGVPLADVDYFPVSVILDNSIDISLRYGIEHAGIVYEAPVEGGMTRLLTVFASNAPVERLGPVRSVRPYFVDWASEYGGILMHVGGSPDALRQAAQSEDFIEIDQIGIHESYFERTTLYDAPHDVFTNAASWRTLASRYDTATSSPASWRFATTTEVTESASWRSERAQLELDYSSLYSVGWVWNAESATWLRFINGDREHTDSGDQIAAANIVVLEVEGRVIDSLGRWEFETIGSGAAHIYRSGREIAGRWFKESASARMRFLDSNSQEEIILQPGVTWIEVVPDRSMAVFKKLAR